MSTVYNWTDIHINNSDNTLSNTLYFGYEAVYGSRSFVMRGDGPDKTRIVTSHISFVYSSNPAHVVGGFQYVYPDVSIQISNIKLAPQYGLERWLMVTYYADNVKLSNMIIDAQTGDTSQAGGAVYHQNTVYFKATNIDIYDAASNANALFFFHYATISIIKNITVMPIYRSYDVYKMYFLRVNIVYHYLVLENIMIREYYTSMLFQIVNHDDASVTMKNITIYDVSGYYFFYFYHGYYSNVTMENIYINVNDGQVTSALFYYLQNYYSTFIISNSIISNIIFDASGNLFWFDQGYSTYDKIYFNNVIFKNMYGGDTYGMIYVNSAFEIEMNNVTFQDNMNFTALIQCSSGSNCKINITNCLFDGNLHGYYQGKNILHTILFLFLRVCFFLILYVDIPITGRI